MAIKALVKNFRDIGSVISAPSVLLAHFAIWQLIVITIYLGSRERQGLVPTFSNGIYLSLVGIATLLLCVHLFFIRADSKLNRQDKIYISIFMSPALVLYLSMFVNYDFKSLQSLTLLFIFLIPLVIWRTQFDSRDWALFNKTIVFISIINMIYSILQLFSKIPVAQINSRDVVFGFIDRPTGIFFNAFAMSYASVIFLAIGLDILTRNNEQRKFGILIFSSSLVSLVLSGTRTSLWLGFLIIILFISLNYWRKSKNVKVTFTLALIVLGVGAPFILLFMGLLNGNLEWSTINGRTQMWNCVTSNANQFLPIGVGLDDAFPPKFCADSGWFSNLRHPENMFLLAFVESGPLGMAAYVLLFIFALIKSFKALEKRFILPIALTSTFLLSNLIYVSLFHYLPFLPDRPADRGIFNFHLMYFIWIWVMKNASVSLNKES